MATIKQKAASPGQGQQAAQQANFSPDTNPIDTMLSRLEGVKRTGDNTWLARCPAHTDKSPSLSIRNTDSGAVLVHCFAGCTVHEVVSSIGLELNDLFPPRPVKPEIAGKPERRRFPAADVLRAIGFEATIITLAALHIHKGGKLSDADRERLLVANGRIQSALDAGGLSHG